MPAGRAPGMDRDRRDRSLPAFMTEPAIPPRSRTVGHDDGPPDQWEARARFPLLLASDSWAYDGEHGSYEESLPALVAAEHAFLYQGLVPA